MVRDAHGRKMSKSLGNVIDPMDVIIGVTLKELNAQLDENSNLDPKEVEKAKAGQKQDYPNGIPECGTDALRFGLCAYTAQGRDINLDVSRINGYRNFCNKLWNATKFAMMNLGKEFKPYQSLKILQEKVPSLNVVDRWMLSQLSSAVKECNAAFEEFNFPRATTALYNLWWYQICDVYLECLKPTMYGSDEVAKELSRNVLYTALHTGLLLISPFMPFLSEELFQRLPQRTDNEPPSVCITPFPETEQFDVFFDNDVEEKFKLGQQVISEIRSAKSKYDIPNRTKIELCLQSDNAHNRDVLESLADAISTLSVTSSFKVSEAKPKGSVPTPVNADTVAWMKLQGIVDLDKCKERINKKISEAQNRLQNLEADMSKPTYEKAPEEIRAKNSEKKRDLEAEISQSNDALKQLEAVEMD